MKRPDAHEAGATAATATGARRDLLRAAALQQYRIAELALGVPLRMPKPPAAPAARARAKAAADEAYNPPPLTLAQRLGLQEAPQAKLSATEWDAVRQTSSDRSQEPQPCAICQEPFAAFGQQLLLSCAHAFHRGCLRSWERHARRRSCPCCRRAYYQTKSIEDGATHYRSYSATALQAGWRARAARRAVALRRARADPEQLRAYCASRLDSLSDALTRKLAQTHSLSDALLAQLERERRARLGLFDEAASAGDGDGVRAGRGGARADATWRARLRGERDCSVCLQPCALRHPAAAAAPGVTKGPRAASSAGKLSVLSCSHVFHVYCVLAFEQFAVGDAPLSCPECRAMYTRWPYEETVADAGLPPGAGAPANALLCAPCAGDEPRAASASGGQAGGRGCCAPDQASVVRPAACPATAEAHAEAAERISAEDIEAMLEARRRQMAGRPRGLALAQQLAGTAGASAQAPADLKRASSGSAGSRGANAAVAPGASRERAKGGKSVGAPHGSAVLSGLAAAARSARPSGAPPPPRCR
ncbi:hypothetical protein T492DRAFT_958532 [Pavlovales sp. CCMP2436]|nr:hypothetical protein T492DRAFT_958532 [Pavlovales sp. CCMP2436]